MTLYALFGSKQFKMPSRRKFIEKTSTYTLGLGLLGLSACSNPTDTKASMKETATQTNPISNKRPFKISLAQWSLHQNFFDKKIDHLDFAKVAREEFGIDAVEYVNGFFKDKAKDTVYLQEMKKRAADNGVQSLLVMIDGEGDLGQKDAKKRKEATENHFKWVDAAQFLGCHSIRVNAFGDGTAEEVQKAAIESMHALASYAAKANINVTIENHGGYSSDGQWLTTVMKKVNLPNFGTLPDFGNFCLEREGGERWGAPCIKEYDKYKGVKELMPFAKAVSAKSYDFDEKGNETTIDYKQMLDIVQAGGYEGYIGVEYEGKRLSEYEGVKATKALLEKLIG